MAVVIPLVGFVAGGMAVGGAIAAGVWTAATVATAIAGAAAMVSSVASLAGNTDLARVAGIVGLVAGGYAAFAGATGAAAGASAETMTTTEATLAAERGNQAISATSNIADAGAGAGTIAQNAAAPSPLAAESVTMNVTGSELKGIGDLARASAQGPTSAELFAATNAGNAPLTAADTASGLTQADMFAASNLGGQQFAGEPSLLQKATQFLKDNKELIKVAGTAADSMWGPKAQEINLLKQRLQMLQDEQARRRANMNNIAGIQLPVVYSGQPLRRIGG